MEKLKNSIQDDQSKLRNSVNDVEDKSASLSQQVQTMYNDLTNFDMEKLLEMMMKIKVIREHNKDTTRTARNTSYTVPDVQSFKESVSATAKRLGISVEDLYAVMAFETGGTFNPAEKNRAGSGATGLIQFMPETAKGLGTTTDELAKMSRTEQMKYVEKFLSDKGISGKGLSDVYMAVLFPAAVGKPDDFVLFGKGATVRGYGEGSKAYEQNQPLDLNNDGSVTKAEASAKVQQYKGVRPEPATVSSDPGQTPNVDQGFRVKSGQDLTSMLGAQQVTSLAEIE